jgi:hypothetical protein
MPSASPSLIGFSWASEERNRSGDSLTDSIYKNQAICRSLFKRIALPYHHEVPRIRLLEQVHPAS